MFNKKAKEERGETGTKVQDRRKQEIEKGREEGKERGQNRRILKTFLTVSRLYKVPWPLQHSFSPDNNPTKGILLTTFYRGK